jgi:catechol 2,3-dioxygenase-like lactoylglutathione lyase family enzyme
VKTLLTLALALAAATPALPQNAPAAAPPAVTPNAAGVSFLHLHFYVRNVEAERAFWLALAGAPQGGRGLRIGTAAISITAGEPKGGNAGTAIDHAAFRVKDLKDMLPKLEAVGAKRLPATDNPRVAFILAPEDIKLELMEDPAVQATTFDHVQFLLKSKAAILPWHQQVLGAEPTQAGWSVPGAQFRITEGKEAPTSKGTSFDHIAFDVGDLAKFLKRLDTDKISYEPVTKIANGARGYTYVMDPGGVYVELMGTLPAAQ